MVCAVAGIVFFFINATLGIALLLAAAACFMTLKGKEKARVKGTEEIAAKYGAKTEDGAKEIDLALGQWKAAKAEASERGSLLKMEKVA